MAKRTNHTYRFPMPISTRYSHLNTVVSWTPNHQHPKTIPQDSPTLTISVKLECALRFLINAQTNVILMIHRFCKTERERQSRMGEERAQSVKFITINLDTRDSRGTFHPSKSPIHSITSLSHPKYVSSLSIFKSTRSFSHLPPSSGAGGTLSHAPRRNWPR